MKRNAQRQRDAVIAADELRNKFNLKKDSNPIGIILGTGWGDKLILDNPSTPVPFKDVFGLKHLTPGPEGHKREFQHGFIEDKEILVLNGRIHLNEDPTDSNIPKLARLQVEILMQLGVKKLIVTCAAGALPESGFETGELAIIDSFMSLLGPPMPLWAGEFVSPEDILSEELIQIALKQTVTYGPIKKACYAMLLGPDFEGRKKDKQALRMLGADIVGMSVRPETCIAALYPDTQVLAVAFISNDSIETHSHEENMKRANESSEKLGVFLKNIMKEI
ncbi:MAG: purine-nucleoside phosphorylase [Candidatus Nomurabacteria bacterium]|nr:purine-nucleoside phosphorylase [Candidatus Nomurabacteria bacterium]